MRLDRYSTHFLAWLKLARPLVTVLPHSYNQSSKIYIIIFYNPMSFQFSSWEPIVDFVDQQYDNFFQDESGLNRKNMSDTRVHCVLHFINPQGHG